MSYFLSFNFQNYCIIDLLMFASIVAVMKYLSRPRGVSRCPVIGCSSIITSDALEKDELMERALRRAQRNKQKT